MSCLFPIQAWRAKRLSESGKRPIVFNRRDGYEDMPIVVPCGKCEGCRADKALTWSIRCHQEASLYTQNSFVTLTYNDENLPNQLVKHHLQDFIRSLRDSGEKIRYYACGEYGDSTNRPHYHACIFGTDFKDGTEQSINADLYLVPRITEMWGKGHVVISEFTMATACYVAGYVAKKIGSQNDDQFQLMSRKPGIGFPWLAKNYKDLLKTETVVIEGKEFPIPPQYFRWAEENLGDCLKNVKAKRADRFKNMPIEKVIDKHRERRAKEVHLKQRLKHQKSKEQL